MTLVHYGAPYAYPIHFFIDLKNPTKKEECKKLPGNGIKEFKNMGGLVKDCNLNDEYCYLQKWKKADTKTKQLVAECIEKDDLGMIFKFIYNWLYAFRTLCEINWNHKLENLKKKTEKKIHKLP